MTEQRRDIDDPVAEVRQWRAKMFQRVGGTLESLAKLLEKGDAERDGRRRRRARQRKSA